MRVFIDTNVVMEILGRRTIPVYSPSEFVRQFIETEE